jgi:hypothetical protein
MNIKNQIRLSGVVGMASAGLWLIALLIEYRYGLQPPGNASLIYMADQIMFFVALAGYLVMLLGLWKSKAAGDGIFGRISLGIFIAGLVSLLIAWLAQLIKKDPNFFLYPVGGIFQLLGGLLTGIAVVTAKRWDGWQRFAPLIQGLYYLLLFFLLVVSSNQSPSPIGEALWQVTWSITSLALFTKSSNINRMIVKNAQE